jgi:hypothetical protein
MLLFIDMKIEDPKIKCRKVYNDIAKGCFICVPCCWLNPFSLMVFDSDYDICPYEWCYCGCHKE